MLLRSMLTSMFLLCFLGSAQAGDETTIQPQINTACSTGGTVALPAVVNLAATLNLRCAPGTQRPVTLRGAPSVINCVTGATPCIVVGSNVDLDDGSGTNNRLHLAIKDVRLRGPGISTIGSEGIKIVPTGDYSILNDVWIDYFDKGLHLVGDGPLLVGVFIQNLKVGALGASVNTAIHLDGEVANALFEQFSLGAQKRLILFDGPGGSGADASFHSGVLNTTLTPGIASVYVDTSDASIHTLTLSDISDWETACPYLEMGNHALVTLNGVAWNGDPHNSVGYPGIKIDASASNVAWLNLNNTGVSYCGTPDSELMRVEATNASIRVLNSSFYRGTVNFVGASRGTFIGNDCAMGVGTTLVGNLTRVRSSTNLGTCLDR